MASLYDMTVLMFVNSLSNLDVILGKAEDDAKANDISPASFFAASLIEDMAPFAFQVQATCDHARMVHRYITGGARVDNRTTHTEKTIGELRARIAGTLDFLAAIKREDIDGKQNVEVVFSNPPYSRKYTGLTYCTEFAIPNFYFHMTMAYAILRSKGVPLGKYDFIGWRYYSQQ